jgi:hypothetical protein
MEAFSPQNKQFLPLQFQLPDYQGCCLFAYNGLLVVHSSEHVLKFGVGQAGQLVQLTQAKTSQIASKTPNSQPVLDISRGLFFIFDYDMCYCFHIETDEAVKHFT